MSDHYPLPDEMILHLKSLTRMVYYVTDEEDVAVKSIYQTLMDDSEGKKNKPPEVKIYNRVTGLQSVGALLADWDTRTLTASADTTQINKALDHIYREDTRVKHFYLITDPEQWLQDASAVRRLLNIVHQVRHNDKAIKVLVFIGARCVIPSKLNPYIHVVRAKHPPEDQVKTRLEALQRRMTKVSFPAEAIPWFKGLNHCEIEAAVFRSAITTRATPGGSRISKEVIQQYKRDRVNRTNLLSIVDVSGFSFDQVGGLDKFKAYADRVKPSWTEEGKAFGLRPPKGVLCVGVWGCGKSLSVKALGSTWGVPVVQLEMGKLRSSAVGETEANVYRAISYLESMAPCVVWVDEAEKSFAGAESSSKSDAGTTARTLGILSTWHQETDAEVCLCLTANSLDTLPVEFTNRIEDRFFFDVPGENDRIDVLKIQLKSQGNLTDDQISEFNLAVLAQAADQLVPREMEQAIRQSLRDSFYEGKPHLDYGILLEELKNRPRILETMSDQVQKILNWVGYDADRDEGVRARMASSKRSTNTLEILKGGS